MTSKANVVADSWEEYDNDITPPLPTPVILQRPPNATPTLWSQATPSPHDFPPLGGPAIRLENSTRSEYTPQIRILKKNDSKPSNNYEKSRTSGSTSSGMTMEERIEEKQRAYNEARRRIMGADYAPPTDDSGSKPASADSSSKQPTSAESSSSFGPPRAGNGSRNNIVREPLGPDGTKGFAPRRS